jgi:hypothetical protein
MAKRVSLDRSAAGVTRQSTMKEYGKPKAEAIADALLAFDQMEITAGYLSSGRRFASLETEETKRRWTEAARTFLIGYENVNPRDMDDLASELALSITVVIFRWHICLISESMGHHDSEIMDDRSID